MKNILIALSLIAGVSLSFADTGWDNAARIERGSYIAMRKVVGSSTTATALFAASTKRPDGICRVNGSYTVWIGTATGTITAFQHPNILLGFPVLSSETFKLDGSMSDDLYVTCDSGVSTCDVRCLDGLVR